MEHRNPLYCHLRLSLYYSKHPKQCHEYADRHQFVDAVAVANIPTLLMVLVQMTGELRWLKPPYRPSRGNGLGDNDSGGFSESIQHEIRTATLEAILAWRDGYPIAIPDPSPELLVEMLSCAMGEPVPPEYGTFTFSLLGHRPVSEDAIQVPEDFHVVIVGAGISGICAAVNLQAAGIPFTILEKNATVGASGTRIDTRAQGSIHRIICIRIRLQCTIGRCSSRCETTCTVIWNRWRRNSI